MRARGFSPFEAAKAAEESTKAAAPSFNEDEFAAVTVPFLSKAGFSVGTLSFFSFFGPSSSEMVTSPAFVEIVMGAISSANNPCFWAACARAKVS